MVGDLQNSTGICIFIDRRIDPFSTVTLTTSYSTTAQVIADVANHVGAEVSLGDDFVMIGPIESAAKLKTLTAIKKKDIQALRRRLDTDTYRRLVESRTFVWEKLATPRKIIEAWAEEIGLVVKHPEVIPHDLLAEAKLPSVTFCDVATALLLQYDLTFRIESGGVLSFAAVPQTVAVEKKYRVAKSEKPSISQRWSAAFPDLEVSWRGGYATIATTEENHVRLQQLLKGDAQEIVQASGLKGRRLTFKAPPGTQREAIIALFRSQDIPVRFEGATSSQLESQLQQTVEIDVVDRSIAEILEEVFKNTGVRVVVSDTEVVLSF